MLLIKLQWGPKLILLRVSCGSYRMGIFSDCSLAILEREFPLMFGDNGNLLWPSRPTNFRNSSTNLAERSLVLSWEPPLDSKYIYSTFLCDSCVHKYNKLNTHTHARTQKHVMYYVYNHPHTILIFLMFFFSNSENGHGTWKQ